MDDDFAMTFQEFLGWRAKQPTQEVLQNSISAVADQAVRSLRQMGVFTGRPTPQGNTQVIIPLHPQTVVSKELLSSLMQVPHFSTVQPDRAGHMNLIFDANR